MPIINLSVVWWNSLHQGPSITLGGSSIDTALLWPLGLTVLGFSLLFGASVLMRMRRIIADNRVAARLRPLADEEECRVAGVITVGGKWENVPGALVLNRPGGRGRESAGGRAGWTRRETDS